MCEMQFSDCVLTVCCQNTVMCTATASFVCDAENCSRIKTYFFWFATPCGYELLFLRNTHVPGKDTASHSSRKQVTYWQSSVSWHTAITRHCPLAVSYRTRVQHVLQWTNCKTNKQNQLPFRYKLVNWHSVRTAVENIRTYHSAMRILFSKEAWNSRKKYKMTPKNQRDERLFEQPHRTALQQWTLPNTSPNITELRVICTVRGQWGSSPAKHVVAQRFLEPVTKGRNKSIKMCYHERSIPEHRSSQISKPYFIRFCHDVVSPWQRSAFISCHLPIEVKYCLVFWSHRNSRSFFFPRKTSCLITSQSLRLYF
jgi:hypothetical protein